MQFGVYLQDSGGAESRGRDAVHRGEVLIGIARAIDALVAVDVMDVIFAVLAFAHVRVVAIELGGALDHGVGVDAQPLDVLRELEAAPIVVCDLGGAAEDVIDRAIGAEAALGDHVAAVLPLARLNPVPAAGVRMFVGGVFLEAFGALLPRLAQEIEAQHFGGDIVRQFLQAVEV